MSGESEGIIAKMWDEYEITKSDAAALAIPIADLPAAQRRLGELKNRIRGLGTVNVAAIEEYKEVAERYNFYKVQIGDVERSKEELAKSTKPSSRPLPSFSAAAGGSCASPTQPPPWKRASISLSSLRGRWWASPSFPAGKRRWWLSPSISPS